MTQSSSSPVINGLYHFSAHPLMLAIYSMQQLYRPGLQKPHMINVRIQCTTLTERYIPSFHLYQQIQRRSYSCPFCRAHDSFMHRHCHSFPNQYHKSRCTMPALLQIMPPPARYVLRSTQNHSSGYLTSQRLIALNQSPDCLGYCSSLIGME